ncbi:MAG: 2OG-Fe(II) oxygenase [Kofleriaceae bacterium]
MRRLQRSALTLDRFAPEGEHLRRELDRRFAEPRRATADRFVWDYWHVPGQYTALRTPAWTYFPKPLYERFHRRLVAWGRSTLGCHDISPPWLSVYIEGCRQELHGDLPHGPWAFVYSLTRWERRAFTGGETLLLRDDVLDFWDRFTSVRSIEEGELVHAVPPRFGRLTVFDPRVPHGVREVRGTHDPRLGRAVIHGWFVQPRPFFTGPLAPAQVTERVAELTACLGELTGGLPLAGVLSVRLEITAAGAVRAVTTLCDTTRVAAALEPQRKRAIAALRRHLAGWRFARHPRGSQLTLPLIFEAA